MERADALFNHEITSVFILGDPPGVGANGGRAPVTAARRSSAECIPDFTRRLHSELVGTLMPLLMPSFRARSSSQDRHGPRSRVQVHHDDRSPQPA